MKVKYIKATIVVALMITSLMPLVTSASSSRFYLVDNFDANNLLTLAKPPGAGKPGGNSPPPQEVDWGVARIGALAFRSGIDVTGITVAILDTGIDAGHEDLTGVVVTCFSGIKRADYSDCSNRNVKDDDGHGTHVAGTIAALNNEIDSVGVASGISLINGKVLGKRGGDWNDLAWSIKHATDLGADVISMSLGGDLSSSPSLQAVLQDAVDYARVAGVAVVAAAGNEGTCQSGDTQVSWPAMNTGVFTIGATGIISNGNFVTVWTGAETDAMPCFSNDMPAGVVDISAPGVFITASKRGGGITDLSGTSMATPHVAAAIALLMALGNSATQAQNILVQNALDIGYVSTLQGAGLMLL